MVVGGWEYKKRCRGWEPPQAWALVMAAQMVKKGGKCWVEACERMRVIVGHLNSHWSHIDLVQ